MGGVVIAKDIKKTKEMIDLAGNVIDPQTKRVIKKEPPEYIPPPPHVVEAWKKERQEESHFATTDDRINEIKSSGLGDKIEKMIESKINKLIEDKIEEVFKRL
jgi:hypothetical protein